MSEKIAILFDAENISPKFATSILANVKRYGSILIQRAYADWSEQAMKGWKDLFSKQPFSVYQQFHNNETQVIDKTIIMDAIQLAIEHPEIDTICLVSSDKGYTQLALRLRELGKYVLGIGEKNKARANTLLVNACNEFLYVEDLKTLDEEILINSEECNDNADTDLVNFSLSKFISQAFDSTPPIKDKEGWVLMSRLAESIKQFKPDFNYKDYKFSSFKQMLESFKDDFQIDDDHKTPPTHIVRKIEQENKGLYEEGTIFRFIHNYGIIQEEKTGSDYFFHCTDILPEAHNEKIRKGLKVKFEVLKKPNPNASETRERNGKAINISVIK